MTAAARASTRVNAVIAGLTLLLSAFVSSYAYYIIATESYRELSGLSGFAVLTLISVLIWWRGRVQTKKRFLYIVYLFMFCELGLQLAAVFNLIPGIHTYKHVPFGRVYWQKEGNGNGIMNRYGWYYPPFREATDATGRQARNIVLIGDSFIEAVQIDARQNIGVWLDQYLDKKSAADSVLSIGLSAAGPAHYLELLKYAARHLRPTEVIFFIYLGNDFLNLSLDEHKTEPAKYIYYRTSADDTIELHPDSRPALNWLRQRLRFNHKNVLISLPVIVKSYLLMPEAIREIRSAIKAYFRAPENNIQTGIDSNADIDDSSWDRLGLSSFVFKTPLSQSAVDAFDMTAGLLQRAKRFAEQNNIELKLVTIPIYPPFFYSANPHQNWSYRIGDYDLSLPERRLIKIAKKLDLNILPMAQTIRDQQLSLKQIRSFYFLNGLGHFTPAGHRFFARALYQEFYQSP